MLKQLGSFVLVGVAGVATNFLVFQALLIFGVHYLLASTFAWLTSMGLVFLLNRRFTFRSSNSLVGDLWRTLVVYSFQQGVVLAGLFVSVSWVGLSPTLGYFAVLPFAVLISFLGMRLFAMRQA